MSTEQFSLCWDNFHKNMSMGMQSLLENEDLVDVTLAVEGRYLKAHKMVLSVCSPYFRELFQTNPCKHPIVFMKDVSYIALSDLLHFMYQGEVQVAQENLTTFIKTAEALQIKGLTGEAGVPNESESEVEPEVTTVPETPAKRPLDTTEPKSTIIAKPKRFSGPACKRPKLTNVRAASVSPAPSVVVTTENKYEVDFVNSNAPDDIDLKTEPGDTLEQSQNDIAEESQLDEATEENSTFEMADETEDFSLIESNNDEPKPGTSAEIGDNQASLIYMVNEKKQMILVYQDNLFYINRRIKNKVFWTCVEYHKRNCKCRLIISNGVVMKKPRQHNHPPNTGKGNKNGKDMFILKTTQGYLRLIYKNQIFNLRSNNPHNHKSYWNCSEMNRRGCRARCITTKEKTILESGEKHNHPTQVENVYALLRNQVE